MLNIKRPRVAVIGLDADRIKSLAPLCGELRTADSFAGYLTRHSLTETDVLVSGAFEHDRVVGGVHLMTIGPTNFQWRSSECSSNSMLNVGVRSQNFSTSTTNTEREVTVPAVCPEVYKTLASELSGKLRQASDPPTVIACQPIPGEDGAVLIESTSGHVVALRLVLPLNSGSGDSAQRNPIALLLPQVTNLADWFGAFLSDIHEFDPDRVPQEPPRLSQPSDWYTPEERVLAERISEATHEIERLSEERNRLQTQLASEGKKADRGIRLIIWVDGDDLVAAATEVLTELGFTVQDMDEELEPNKPKREDLRLTLKGKPDWKALVEVKGYTNGTRSNDSRQIREHREKYTAEKGQTPDLTVWLANPFRARDPSHRPDPDNNVRDAAAIIGAVHVLASDLYMQWVLVKTGRLEAQAVVQDLIDAEPGLWAPRA